VDSAFAADVQINKPPSELPQENTTGTMESVSPSEGRNVNCGKTLWKKEVFSRREKVTQIMNDKRAESTQKDKVTGKR